MTLRLTNISKRFGPTVALDDVSFTAESGQIHALLGENGAGKSTLMQIAYGLQRADSGTVNGTPGFVSPRAARAAGIGMVHQHFTSIPAFTVAENIALAAGWRETGQAAEQRAREVVKKLGLDLPVGSHAEGLSVQLRQRLEIAKALAADARILLLDEPTAVLAPREVGELLVFIRAFAERGGTVVLITHKLDEVFRVAERVTVLRRGSVVLSESLVGQTPQTLSRAMIGTEISRAPVRAIVPGDVAVRAVDVRIRPDSDAASFTMRGGEIVGIAAIEGNGQRELLRTIAGVDGATIAAGSLEVAGPVAFIPEDRTTEGAIGAFTLTENLLLGALDRSSWWLDWQALRARASELMLAHDVRAESPDVAMATLSGGNQQKFVFATALQGVPRVVVAEDPSRGLDVQATQAIHDALREAARNGAAVVVHSSDLDEVLELADRIIVLARSNVRELPAGTPRELIGDAMLAVGPPT
ncbi:MAG: ATP-binding cassette domain-containing protein [Gemmatimonadota bacterium]